MSNTIMQHKIKASSKVLGVGAGMFVVTVAMTAIGGTMGGIVGAFIAGTAFATGLVLRSQEKRR